MKDGTVDLITDSALKENFLVFSIKTNIKILKKILMNLKNTRQRHV